MSKQQPALHIKVLRAGNVESQHQVSALVCDDQGENVASWGPVEGKIYPRSSVKPLQAMAIVLSGAAENFSVSDKELAVACASHSGEELHLQIVKNWLHRLGLSVSDLECGSHPPFHTASYAELLRQGGDITALHNNCSGKHTGMLAVALALKAPTKNYVNADHPVQIFIRDIFQEMSGEKISRDCVGIDGCSLPTYFMSVKALATAMARFASGEHLPYNYADACKRIYNAAVENPLLIAGTDRYCTRLTLELNKTGLVKTGAEGVMFAAIPGKNLGIVVKAHDGAVRAAEIAMSHVLKELGVLSAASWEKFSELPLRNWNQTMTGSVTI